MILRHSSRAALLAVFAYTVLVALTRASGEFSNCTARLVTVALPVDYNFAAMGLGRGVADSTTKWVESSFLRHNNKRGLYTGLQMAVSNVGSYYCGNAVLHRIVSLERCGFITISRDSIRATRLRR